MARQKKVNLGAPPDLSQARKNILRNIDDLEYGLRAVIRILSRTKRNQSYFIQEFEVLFASELNEKIAFQKTFVDHENLKIIIKLPDPPNPSEKEKIRYEVIKDFTLGIDDLRARAGLIVLQGLDEEVRKKLILQEKEIGRVK